MSSDARVVLPGSEHALPPDGRPVGPTDPNARIEVSVMVRPRRPLDEPEAGQYLSREAFAARYGADPTDLAKVDAFARESGLQVLESSAARRTVRLAGRAADLAAAFGVELVDYKTFHAPKGLISVPAGLGGIVQSVFGLDSRPLARRAASVHE